MSEVGTIEVVRKLDAVPVLAPTPARRGGLIRSVTPASQAVVVAAGGFVAGAAVVGLAVRRRAGIPRASAKRRGARAARRSRGAKRGELVKIVGTRSLLVDVHLLGGTER